MHFKFNLKKNIKIICPVKQKTNIYKLCILKYNIPKMTRKKQQKLAIYTKGDLQ